MQHYAFGQNLQQWWDDLSGDITIARAHENMTTTNSTVKNTMVSMLEMATTGMFAVLRVRGATTQNDKNSLC